MNSLKQKSLKFALEIFILILTLGILTMWFLNFFKIYEDKFFPRVTISGLPVGGQTLEQAKQNINQYGQEINSKSVELTFGESNFTPRLADLGVKFDTEKTVDEAFSYGRRGTLINKIKENFNLAFFGYNTALVAQIDKKILNDYIDSLAKKIDIPKIDQKVLDTDGKIIEEGQDGQILDQDQLASDIQNQIASGQTVFSIELATIVVPKEEKQVKTAFTPGDYYGRYIDVNLSTQKMQLFDNNQLVQEYTVSSGKASTPTPIGTRYIQNKSPRAWSPDHGLWMPWWNGLGGGYGIHELPEWPNGYKEGAAHLGTPVSHGCVRLGVGPAKFVYDWAPIGSPVYIHR